jgi:hypothetical protein
MSSIGAALLNSLRSVERPGDSTSDGQSSADRIWSMWWRWVDEFGLAAHGAVGLSTK